VAIEYDNMTFANSAERDKFLDDRELRRKGNKYEFRLINEHNGNAASTNETGVWASTKPGPRGVAAFHVFSDPDFFKKIQECHIFKMEHPDWEWDTTKKGHHPKMVDKDVFNEQSKALLHEIRNRPKGGSPYAGMGLREILKAQKAEQEIA